MTPTAQDYEEYSTSAFSRGKYPAASNEPFTAPAGAEGLGSAYGYREAVTSELDRLTKMGILEQRIRVLWNKDLARLEALVRDAANSDVSAGHVTAAVHRTFRQRKRVSDASETF